MKRIFTFLFLSGVGLSATAPQAAMLPIQSMPHPSRIHSAPIHQPLGSHLNKSSPSLPSLNDHIRRELSLIDLVGSQV